MGRRDEFMKVVSVNDPAIDTLKMTVAEMIEYRDKRDYALIERFIKPGEKPTVWHIREVPRKIWSRFVSSATTADEKYERCMFAGLMKVENLYQPDGTFLTEWTPPRDANSGIASDELLERVYPGDVAEIGAVILGHSFLAPRTRRSFPLPPMCQEALGERVFRRADASLSSPATPSDKASQPEAVAQAAYELTDPSNSASGSPSGSPTAATATATATAGA